MLFPGSSNPVDKSTQAIKTAATPKYNGDCQDQSISKFIEFLYFQFFLSARFKPVPSGVHTQPGNLRHASLNTTIFEKQ